METHHTEYNKRSSQEKHLPQPFYQQISFLGGCEGEGALAYHVPMGAWVAKV